MTADRKPRRLSLHQARACELGISIKPGAKYPVRCRCGGRYHGARRVPAKPTRWDFATLPADDPHHIPPIRRRISPRTALLMLANAKKHQHAHAPQQVIYEAQQRAAVTVAKERCESEVRTRRTRILQGYFYPWRRRNRSDWALKSWRGEYHPADPLGWALRFLQRCTRHVQAWMEHKTLGPPGHALGPPVDRRVGPQVGMVLLQAQMELV